MRSAAHPRRTTALVGALLAVLLLVGGWVAAHPAADRHDRPDPATASSAAPAPAGATPVGPPPSAPVRPAAAPPRPGAAYPVRELGALADRSRLVTLRGNAELRYLRAPANATRLHFICTGCDADTWLSTRVGGAPGGPGLLPDPVDVTTTLDAPPDTGRAGRTSRLLVKAPAVAEWTVSLTPFDEVPVHRTSFDTLGDDVVAVRSTDGLVLRCPGPSHVRVLARATPSGEYAVVADERHGAATFPVPRPAGARTLVLAVTCPGRWSVTVP